MTTISLSANPLISTWESSTSTADVMVGGVTLTGTAAAAYQFGKALQTVKYQGLLDGVQLTDARYQFPPVVGEWVSLSEVADALHYKYGVDPLIEFAPGLGQRGYSVADINAILGRLNQEFKGQFSLDPIASSTVASATRSTFDSERLKSPVAPTATATGSTDEYVSFATDPKWSTGTPVRVSASGGGLSANTDYFLRNLGGGKYSFFTTQAAASGTSTTGRVDLTANVTGSVSYSPPRITASDVSGEWVQFSTDPDWLTGTSVRVSATGGGLSANTDYYVRNLGAGKYSFFTTAAASAGTGTTNRVDLSAGILNTTTASFSVDINNTAALASVLDTSSTPAMASATEAELRASLTAGGDLYVDRHGAFFINGVPTTAKDVAVVSRLLAQDNISAQYKVLMDEYAERNNLIASAHAVLDGGLSGVNQSTASVQQQYGWSDVLSELTSGQFSDNTFAYWATDLTANTVTFESDPSWVTGKQVRVDQSAGGLTAGTDYFLRNLGNGAYSFFTTQANALGNTGAVDLTARIPRATNFQVQDAAAVSTAGVSALPVAFTPAKKSGDTLKNYDLLANSYYFDDDKNSSTNKDNYLIFSPINPGWPEDTALEFTGSGGGLTAGTDYYVANWYAGGATRVQFTGGAGGSANTEDNKLTAKPSGQVMLYDGGSTPGSEKIEGYNQFNLAGTNFATGTSCVPSEDVHVLLTHTHGSDNSYKAIVALHAGTTYYLRNNGSGNYSIYDTENNAKNGTEEGRLYFQIDDGTYTGSTRSPYITSATATINGLSSGLTINGGNSQLTFDTTKDPLWADGTAVKTRTSGGGLTAGVTYYTRKMASGQYAFYTSQSAATTGGATGRMTVYAPPVPGGLYQDRDQGIVLGPSTSSRWDEVTALLNTLISNKVRDGDLDQAKLQTLTAQMQNNTEAMTALIKVFSDLNATLVQALR